MTTTNSTAQVVSATSDSGWIAANNNTSNTIVIEHNLGVIPAFISVMFSPDKTTAYTCTRFWSQENNPNPVSIEATSTTITINIVQGYYLFGAWSGATGNWTHWNSGYFRVCATK